MKTIRIYLSAYPWWYKVITLTLAPLAFFIINLIFSANEPSEDSITAVCLFWEALLAILEIETEYFSLGDIYRKSEPFGKLVLTSNRKDDYFRRFAKGDVIRRMLYGIGLLFLPQCINFLLARAGVLTATTETEEGIMTAAELFNGRFLFHSFLLGVMLYVTLQLSVYVLRHIHTQVLMVVVVIGVEVLIVLLPVIYEMLYGTMLEWIYAAGMLLLAGIITWLSLRKAKKASEECYYDK